MVMQNITLYGNVCNLFCILIYLSHTTLILMQNTTARIISRRKNNVNTLLSTEKYSNKKYEELFSNIHVYYSTYSNTFEVDPAISIFYICFGLVTILKIVYD